MNDRTARTKTAAVYALIIAPHPDDAEFGIAGTVAKWAKEGKKIETDAIQQSDDIDIQSAKDKIAASV